MVKVTEEWSTELKDEASNRKAEDRRISEQSEGLYNKLAHELREAEHSILSKCEEKFLANQKNVENLQGSIKAMNEVSKDPHFMQKEDRILAPIQTNAPPKYEENTKSFYNNYLKRKAELIDSNKKYSFSRVEEPEQQVEKAKALATSYSAPRRPTSTQSKDETTVSLTQ
eukprot:TRINITY_DN9489_c0_g1_i2.p1 TRINITY_DN9489_c0_g1~~TRINITY_DN9489_c0_g1_i2.p1  ORF type:complete len:170 (+),score=40.54 TRINITY_DN9489_c0_g1_i2:573-1082(+)